LILLWVAYLLVLNEKGVELKVTQRPHLLFQIDIRHINSDAKDVTEAVAD
jgi:hypothetical protein